MKKDIKRIIELCLNAKISIDDNDKEYIRIDKNYQKMLWEIANKIVKYIKQK